MDIEQLPAIPESLERGLWQREPPALQLLSQKRHLAWVCSWELFLFCRPEALLALVLAALLPPMFTYW